jgi:hypothetical protein
MTSFRDTIRRQAQAMPTPFLICRTWQHIWNAERGTVVREGAVLAWTVTCDRCGTRRTMRLSARQGYPRGNSYTYPAGYQFHDLPAYLDRQDRGELRLLLVNRITEQA